MGSKRTKKSKQELEVGHEKNNKKKKPEGEFLEPEINVSAVETNGVLPKAQKRKRKMEGVEAGPRKIKKTAEAKPKKNNNNIASAVVSEPAAFKSPGDLNKSLSDLTKSSSDLNSSVELLTDEKEVTWSNEDIMQLIDRIEHNIPGEDNLAYKSRVEKLDWNNVVFNDYTAEQCKRTWILVQKRIRRYRLLGEILNDARDWISKPKNKATALQQNSRLPKIPKHPDMPRRPISSYLLFYLKQKDQIISTNPGLDASDYSKLIGQIYTNLPPEKKEIYEKEAAANRKEYKENVKVFFENHPELAPAPRTRSPRVEKEKSPKTDPPITPKAEKLSPKVEKPTKAPPKVEKPKTEPKPERPKPKAEPKLEKPKPPRTAPPRSRPGKSNRSRSEKTVRPVRERPPRKNQTPFGLYYESETDNRPEGLEKNAFRERCKEQYNQMADVSKVHWINLAEEDVGRYQEELRLYKEKHPEFEVNCVKSVLTKSELGTKERAAGKPVKPANSAYGLYSRLMLKSDEIKTYNAKERMIIIANRWKDCPEEEKNVYRDRVVGLMEQYKTAYAAYVETLPGEERRVLEEAEENKRKQTRARRAAPKKSSGKPTRRPSKAPLPKVKFTEPEQPPISACKYFAKIYKGDENANTAWKALRTEEKRKYEAELTIKKQEYIVEFERFLKSLSKDELEAFSQSRQQAATDDDSSDCSSDSEGEEEEEENGVDEGEDENEESESD